MSIAAIREGLATRLGTISGLRSSSFVPDNPTPPIAVVVPERVDFDTAMRRGLDTLAFNIVVIAQRASERGAQAVLDGYCSSTGSASVKAAVEGDRTLGGAAQDCRVTAMSNYGPLLIGETTYLAATFQVSVLANT